MESVLSAAPAVAPSISIPVSDPATPVLPHDLAVTKQAIELVRQRQSSEAMALSASIRDPAAQKLVEWALLRRSDTGAAFERYAAFMDANSDWPSLPRLRRLAEARLSQEQRDPATVHRFIGRDGISGVGRLAIARVLMGEGDRTGAEREIRAAWHASELSAEVEVATLAAFPGVLTHSDSTSMVWRAGRRQFSSTIASGRSWVPALG